MRALALLTTNEARDADLVSFLRVVAAYVACDIDVELVEAPWAHGALADEDLPDEAERILEQLDAFGIRPLPLSEEACVGALSSADCVLRLGSPKRAGVPDVLLVESSEAVGVEPVLSAGQVARR